MTALHQRLNKLDSEGTAYELDYLTLISGFVYRNAEVLHHDEDSIIIKTRTNRGELIETFINISEISTSRIRTL
ncbi:hypothetical protein H7H48_15755 [Nitratireductor sp. B36]|uniref:hypothetical protein n=1 Tax=Nitratireductor sp. B36 TaxID=2762059 RepID=UPI001E5A0B00|nr:hypothetical protein [Nitratireductor sp. B36]MCC5780516.1 hypothetical protein [Nitratireductor sp. B36]